MDKIEFSKKFEQHKTKLYGFAMKLTRNHEDAKDLIQETVYRAYKNIDNFRPGSNFKSWITTIMRNTFINKYRKDQRRFNLENYLEATRHQRLAEEIVQNQGESNQLLEELEEMMDALKGDLKYSFMLKFRGYKYEEIAKKLNLPLGSVKSKIFYAKKELRKMIQHAYQVNHFSEVLA